MAKPGLQTISANNTFQVWLDRTNEIVEIVKTEVITASVLGDTTGSAPSPLSSTLIGTFTANNVVASTLLRADEISPKIGSLGISINAPIQVDTPGTTAITVVGTLGPRVAFNKSGVEWIIGYDASNNENFIIDSGTGARKFIITPAGNLTASGVITAASGVVANVTGNSSTATKLATARTIGITGDIVWTSPDFDGSANVTAVAEIQANVVGNAEIRDSTGLSVIGRASNTLGDPADVVASTDHQVLRRSGTTLGFGSIALNQAAAVTGVLPVSNGGTGIDTFTSGRIVFGSGTSALGTNANLFWDNANSRLGINQASPEYAVDVTGDVRATGLFRGTATSAQYGDLAEKYIPDHSYEPGTVMTVGGDREVTAAMYDDKVIGVVSTQPGLMMNSELIDGVYIALKGRVPVKSVGEIVKGDLLIPSELIGFAKKGKKTDFNVFGVALGSSKDGVVEAVIL